jgi:hypothetical protein
MMGKKPIICSVEPAAGPAAMADWQTIENVARTAKTDLSTQNLQNNAPLYLGILLDMAPNF